MNEKEKEDGRIEILNEKRHSQIFGSLGQKCFFHEVRSVGIFPIFVGLSSANLSEEGKRGWET